jgi:hypothetical protein
MILSDREVRAGIQRKIIWVTPCPPASDPRWSATTLDLTLDAELRPWKALGGAVRIGDSVILLAQNDAVPDPPPRSSSRSFWNNMAWTASSS